MIYTEVFTSNISKKGSIMQPVFDIPVENIVTSLHVVHRIKIKLLKLTKKEADYLNTNNGFTT